jgi:hypothetical protein
MERKIFSLGINKDIAVNATNGAYIEDNLSPRWLCVMLHPSSYLPWIQSVQLHVLRVCSSIGEDSCAVKVTCPQWQLPSYEIKLDGVFDIRYVKFTSA